MMLDILPLNAVLSNLEDFIQANSLKMYFKKDQEKN
ncbi:MAG: hypothetical protein ACI8QD_000017 [Cyclobacteriaceae bacterium]|jgi:hypothetical protein